MTGTENNPGGIQPVRFDIRLGTMDDVDAMALTEERANAGRDGKPLPGVITDEYRREEVRTRLGYRASWAYLAENGEDLAGFVLGHPSETEDTIEPLEQDEYLALLMVEPGYWRAGIGRALLDIAASSAKDNGKERMILWTGRDNNERAHKFYRRDGYVLTGKQRPSKQTPDYILDQYILDLTT